MTQADLEQLEVSENSFIEFYKNGVKQPCHFRDIWEADYFAAVSVYMNARVAVNFGQSNQFKFLDAILKERASLNLDGLDGKAQEHLKK